MAVKISPSMRQQFEDVNGNPYAGGKLFTYAAGSSTKQATYTDSTGTAANSNPIILDAAGRTPFGLWLTAGLNYKFVLALSTDTDPPSSPVLSEDVISGVNDSSTVSQWQSSGAVPTYINATRFTVPGDKTLDFEVGRRVKITVSAGTVYGKITASVFTTLTDVTVLLDSGALDTGLSAVDLSLLTSTKSAIPAISSANVTYTPLGTGVIATTVQGQLQKLAVSVLDFGADPTGVVDSTAAFNLATKSTYVNTGNSDLGFPGVVIVPAGQYRITGTVYVHKGQHLAGAGMGATRILLSTFPDTAPVFKLGFSTTGADNASGLMAEISGMWTFGGPASYGVMYSLDTQVSIHDIMLTSSGIGIYANSGDLSIYNISIDQALTGMMIGSHNHTITNVNMFLAKYGIITIAGTIGTICSDSNWTNINIHYSEFASVLFGTAVDNRNITFTNCNFTLNAQFAGFSGHVVSSCNYAKNIQFNGCTFANMKGPAIAISSGIDNEFYYNDCIFDGNKSAPDYTQSTTAYAASITSSLFEFNNCAFKNLLANPIKAVTGAGRTTRVFIRGGSFSNNAGTVLVDTTGTTAVVIGSILSFKDINLYDESQYPTNAVETNWTVETDIPMRGTTTYPVISGRSTTFIDTGAGTWNVQVPRLDWGAGVGARHGNSITYIDYAGTWAGATMPGFLTGDTNIDATPPLSTWNPPVGSKKVTLTYNKVTNTWRTH